MSPVYCRVFGLTRVEPAPAAIQELLGRGSFPVACQVQQDDEGWYGVDLLWKDGCARIDRYFVGEEGIRRELNTWAAWVESTGEGEVQTRLMQRLIGTQQLLVTRDLPNGLAQELGPLLAAATDGVYQVDGQGFFSADGSLLLREIEDQAGG